MTPVADLPTLKMAFPKGRIRQRVSKLLAATDVRMSVSDRGYRRPLSLLAVDAKPLEPQNTVELLRSGTHHVGFAGADWVAELVL